MPTYAYECPKCGHAFQKFHKMSARARPKCPECGAVAERKITGGAGLLFKGSGFYITDYKKGGEKAAEAGGDAAKPAKPEKPEKPEKPDAKKAKPKKETDH